MKLPLHSTRLRRAARHHFGWRSLRPGQLAAMRAVMKGRDALVVLSTGAGKSAIYQVPAALLPGPTVVISPLLALQQDQIRTLNERDNPRLRAVRVSSAETPNQQAEALHEIEDGRARFLFITPEQLSNPEVLAKVRALRPALVAVDEAHCISAWGNDFRPDYLALGHLIRGLGRPPVVALTATASPPVREDIVARLGLVDPRTVVAGLDRPNLFLEVAHCPTEDYRWRRLIGLLDGGQWPGIVYVPTRRAAEEAATRLTDAGHAAEFYHGGMPAGARTELHERFLADQVPIMVATSAFGMGIDKPNIRWVAHVALPDSPDSYLQEIGRAGRDGEPAHALLLWRAEDIGLQRFFTGGTPDAAELTELAAALHEGPATRTALRERTGMGARKLGQLPRPAGTGRRGPYDGNQSAGQQPPVRPGAGGGGPGGGRRGRAAAGGTEQPYGHDAGVRRDHRLPEPGPAGVLRRAAHHDLRALRQLPRRHQHRRRRGERAVPGAQHGGAHRVGAGDGDELRGRPDDGPVPECRIQDAFRTRGQRTGVAHRRCRR